MKMPESVDIAPRVCHAVLAMRSDAVVYSDSDGIIRLWNPGAHRIFGFPAEEAVGQNLDIIIPERQRERHWQGYRSVMKSGTSRYGEGDVLAVPAIRKDGTRISVEFTIALVFDSEGRVEGAVAVLRDVTARFEELRALRQAVTPKQ